MCTEGASIRNGVEMKSCGRRLAHATSTSAKAAAAVERYAISRYPIISSVLDANEAVLCHAFDCASIFSSS